MKVQVEGFDDRVFSVLVTLSERNIRTLLELVGGEDPVLRRRQIDDSMLYVVAETDEKHYSDPERVEQLGGVVVGMGPEDV